MTSGEVIFLFALIFPYLLVILIALGGGDEKY
jgi:hypothetical protein